jgi:ppGpp synthetase/RelA/SpoT-type nucleotidyltranferase
MPRLSNRQLDELGDRLRRSDPTAEDLELLGQVRNLYAGALGEVTRVLVDLGLEPGARLKTTGTLIDKLRRIPGMQLSRIQDVAGARVVAEMTRAKQDRLVERITARFAEHRVKDRRAEPSYGYRAVHVIVRVQGRPVEIQVRTHLQDLWAQIVERLADRWGRGIRYGEPPSEPDLPAAGGRTRHELVERVMELAMAVHAVEQGSEMLAIANRAIQEIRARGEEPPPPLAAQIASTGAQLALAEQQAQETLLRLHDATEPDTLKP